MASVKFNERLKSAIDINILGTQKVMELVKEIVNLKVKGNYVCRLSSTFPISCHVYHTSYLCENLRDRLENENDDGVIIASAIKYTKINELKIF